MILAAASHVDPLAAAQLQGLSLLVGDDVAFFCHQNLFDRVGVKPGGSGVPGGGGGGGGAGVGEGWSPKTHSM